MDDRTSFAETALFRAMLVGANPNSKVYRSGTCVSRLPHLLLPGICAPYPHRRRGGLQPLCVGGDSERHSRRLLLEKQFLESVVDGKEECHRRPEVEYAARRARKKRTHALGTYRLGHAIQGAVVREELRVSACNL